MWGNGSMSWNIKDFTAGMLFYNDLKHLKHENLLLCKWSPEDFLEYIKYYDYKSGYELCLTDLKHNLDKYLNEAIIKSII